VISVRVERVGPASVTHNTIAAKMRNSGLAANECGLSDDEGNDARADSDSSSDASTANDRRMPVSKRRRVRQPDQDEILHSHEV